MNKKIGKALKTDKKIRKLQNPKKEENAKTKKTSSPLLLSPVHITTSHFACIYP